MNEPFNAASTGFVECERGKEIYSVMFSLDVANARIEEIKMKMAIDPFKVVGKALVSAKKQRVPRRVVFVDYDEEADVLYVKFRYARMIDSVDAKELEAAGFNEVV